MNGRKQRVLILSNIEWGFIWQRHQTIATLFSRDYDVFFIELPGTRRIKIRDVPAILRRLRRLFVAPSPTTQNVRILRPLILPESWFFARKINEWILRLFVARTGLSDEPALVWVYAVSPNSAFLMKVIPVRKLVYDCVDNFLALKELPNTFVESEKTLLAKADITFVPSDYLRRIKEGAAKNLIMLPHGVLLDRFRPIGGERNRPRLYKLAYYGHIHDHHFDANLVTSVAHLRTEWKILLIGPQKTKIRFPKNVILVGQVDHRRIIEFIMDTEVIFFPYLINEYTNASLPAKIYECLATGLPIVSTPTTTLVKGFSHAINFASTPDDVVRAIEQVEQNGTAASRRVEEAVRNAWEKRYREILSYLKEDPQPWDKATNDCCA